MKKLFYLILLVFFGISSCEKDDPVLDREKFIGTYSGTQTVTLYVNDELIFTASETGIETVERGISDNEILIGRNSNNEVRATVIGNNLSIATQPILVTMEDGPPELFSTSGNGSLNGSNLVINLDMIATIDGELYHYEVKELLEKD